MRTLFFLLISLILYSCTNTSPGKKSSAKTPVQIEVAAYNVEYSKNASAKKIGGVPNTYDFDVVQFVD